LNNTYSVPTTAFWQPKTSWYRLSADILRRYPPFVDGDGQHNIGDLIDEENAIRKSMNLHPVIFPIKKSAAIAGYLKKQGLDFDSVPAKDERVHLFNRVALSPGGVIETIDIDSVHPDNAALFKDVVKRFDATVLGIDVIFENGIESGQDSQRCIMLEVNSRPYMKMHDVPRYGEKPDLKAFYANMEQLDVADADTF